MPSSKPSPTPAPKPSKGTTARAATLAKRRRAVQPASSTSTPATSSSSHNLLKIIIVVIVIFLGLSVLGGIAIYFVARTVVERGIDAATGGKVKLTTNGTKSTIKLNNGSATFSTDGKLPDGFPGDVPAYSPATLKLSFSGANHSYSATWSTTDSNDRVLAWYKTQLGSKGWVAKDDSQVVVGSVATISYTKDSRELVLIVTAASGSTVQTAINLSVTSPPAAGN